MKKTPRLLPLILYREENFIAVHKPAGLNAYGEPGCLEALEEKHGQKLFPVHRLDKETEGVILYALNRDMASRLSRLFQTRKAKKTYTAVVWGKIDKPGMIQTPLIHPKTKEKELARTDYFPLGYLKFNDQTLTLLRCEPQTGRFHQLRRHLEGIKHSIVGDYEYGPQDLNEQVRESFGGDVFFLCASELSFFHPTERKMIKVSTKMDPALEKWIQKNKVKS